MWHEWLCKTNFSFLLGASHPQEIIERAYRLGYASICINDFDGVYGLARAYRAFKDLLKKEGAKANSFKLHYGAELHLKKDHDEPILLQSTLALLVQNDLGYRNLCNLMSLAHIDGKKYAALSPEILLNHDLTGLVAIVPMRGTLRYLSISELEKFWAPFSQAFSERFYFAISSHLHQSEDHWQRVSLTLAMRLSAPVIFSQDIFFHEATKKPLSDLLHAIRTNRSFETASEHYFPNAERSLQTVDDLKLRYRQFGFFSDAIKNSSDLAKSINFDLASLCYYYPKKMIPEGYSAHEYLTYLSWQGIKNRLGSRVSSRITALIQKELDLIAGLKFADYFLTVWDIVFWARSRGILCQGRGSAANSSVCFALGITEADPSLFDLLFERFISKERGDPPDIDVDFEHQRREEVIQYIYDHYGRDNAAMVANVITFRGKGSLRAVGKALAMNESDLTKLSQISSSKHLRGVSLREKLAHLTKDRESEFSSGVLDMWADLADQLRGFPRHLGIHSGGFMLADQPLKNLVALEPATMPGRQVIQWCKEDIEALGFFKIDILALGILSAITKTFSYIEKNYQKNLSMYLISQTEDQPTYQMIQKADTVGTFQIESRAQMSMLPRLKPRCFYDLVIEVAIIRPGPIQGGVIHPYLRRREGLEAVTYADERLRPILEKTLGIPIFQEQAMRVAIAVGNFTPGEADELRRHIGVWNIKDYEKELSPMLKKLADGMKQNQIEDAFAQQILNQMRGFAEYGFPESHAISFALIAYVSCYLKRHYPAEFFAGILNAQPMGFYSPHSLLQAAKRDGVRVLPICVLHSNWDHGLERLEDGRFGIRLGFRVISGLRKSSALELMKMTRHWQSSEEFFGQVSMPRSDLCVLALSDAFHCFGLSRSEALWQAQAAPFSRLIDALVQEDDDILWGEEEPQQKVQRDFAAFSTTLGEHPCVLMREHYWDYAILQDRLSVSQDLLTSRMGVVTVFGMILFKQAPPSAKGMVFITLEDQFGFINLVFTPPTYGKWAHLIEGQGFLCASGRLQKDGSSHSVLVNMVYKRIPNPPHIIK